MTALFLLKHTFRHQINDSVTLIAVIDDRQAGTKLEWIGDPKLLSIEDYMSAVGIVGFQAANALQRSVVLQVKIGNKKTMTCTFKPTSRF